MTRVIKNKAVVPKDYVICAGGHSYNPGLSVGITTTHNIGTDDNLDLEVAPFDLVYEGGYNYADVNNEVELPWGVTANPIDITYKIIFNIVPQNQLRFFRFIITPNVDVHISKTGTIYANDFTTPCINLTFNKCFSSGTVSSTNSITIEFEQYTPLARIVGGDTTYNIYYRSNAYSIIYDALTNEVYNDTENGTNFWGEIEQAAAAISEEIDETETTNGGIETSALEIPESGMTQYFEGARINKAVVPQDYARLIHTVTNASAITSINTVTHDLTAIDVSSLPNYDMVGEIECVYPSVTVKSINGTANRVYYITRKFNLNPELVNKYRLIRLIVQPNINLLVSTGPITLYFQVQYVIDGEAYSNNILLANRLAVGSLINTGTNKYAFIFDTKTKEFYNDTANGTGLWSSKYNVLLDAEEDNLNKL